MSTFNHVISVILNILFIILNILLFNIFSLFFFTIFLTKFIAQLALFDKLSSSAIVINVSLVHCAGSIPTSIVASFYHGNLELFSILGVATLIHSSSSYSGHLVAHSKKHSTLTFCVDVHNGIAYQDSNSF